eukprot:GHVQ01039167.1.p1 GENE.GHVQ01039167.1~~GHVQ01039167.1.p1  ORF type:complete len:126 (+),score=5.36 GHVQ01039167.1:29-406(+)
MSSVNQIESSVNVQLSDQEQYQENPQRKKSASAGNRTRVTSMATRYSTTRPQMLYIVQTYINSSQSYIYWCAGSNDKASVGWRRCSTDPTGFGKEVACHAAKNSAERICQRHGAIHQGGYSVVSS